MDDSADLRIFFDYGRADLTKSAGQLVDAAAGLFKSSGAKGLRIVGHSDASELKESGTKIALARADAIQAALVKRGVPAAKITVAAGTPADMLVKTAEGVREPQNRRAVISFLR